VRESTPRLRACLRDNDMNRTGTAVNLSLSGVYALFKGPIQAAVCQSIPLGFTSAVGILEVSGTISEIPTSGSCPEHRNHAPHGERHSEQRIAELMESGMRWGDREASSKQTTLIGEILDHYERRSMAES
jgi:hypothetical protein